MPAVTFKGIAIPLLLSLLDKRENSNWEEHTKLIDKFIRLFGADCIDPLVADRDFVGKERVGYINNMRIRYYLRIKQNFWLSKDIEAWT